MLHKIEFKNEIKNSFNSMKKKKRKDSFKNFSFPFMSYNIIVDKQVYN